MPLSGPWLYQLAEMLCQLGAPFSLSAPDKLLCIDLEFLRSLKPRQRMSRLRWAKSEALRQYLDDCVDQIREVTEDGDHDLAAVLLGGFIADEFDGRDNTSTPPAQATLLGHFYGAMLSPEDISRWSRLAVAATRRPTADRNPEGPVVYFKFRSATGKR